VPIRLRTILIGGVVVAAAAVVVATLLKPEPEPCMPGDADCPIPPPPCEQIGTRDFNPSNRPVAPRHDADLAPQSPGGGMPFGFNDSAALVGQVSLEQDLDLYRGVGATIWRQPLDWGALQPDPDRLDLAHTDEVYCGAIEAGVAPLFAVTGIPSWAAGTFLECEVPCLRPPDEAQYPALRRFAELIAIRYPQAAAIEVWNEPNLESYWRDGPDPSRYVEVLREIYTGVKDGNPRMPVLGGSLSNNPADASGNLSLQTYIEEMAADGAGAYMDAVSIHPYPTAPLDAETEQFQPALDVTRSVAARAADWPQHIWVTETGIATPPGAAFSPPVSEEVQATTNREIYRRLDAAGDVDAVLFHTLVEPDPALIPGGSGFGWVGLPDAGLPPKPVYCAFARMADQQPAGC
jgi:hypothetical protein